MKKLFIAAIVCCLAAIALIVSSQNTEQIRLNYILAEQELVLSQALSIFFFIGFLLASIVWWGLYTKAKLSNYLNKRKVNQLQLENERLRIQLKDL